MMFQRLPVVLSILMAVLLSGAVYLQIKPLLSPKTTNVNDPGTLIPAASDSKQKHNIASFKLFGNTNAKPKIVSAPQEELPVTTLRLTLTGVLSSMSDQEASALIEGPDRQTLTYKIGDKLPGNAILKQVFTDRVIVSRAGQLENLYFPEIISTGLSPANANLPDYSTLLTSPYLPANRPATSSNSIKNTRKQSIKDRLSKLRKRMIGKPK